MLPLSILNGHSCQTQKTMHNVFNLIIFFDVGVRKSNS